LDFSGLDFSEPKTCADDFAANNTSALRLPVQTLGGNMEEQLPQNIVDKNTLPQTKQVTDSSRE